MRIAILLLMVTVSTTVLAKESQYYSYDDFIRQVDAGKIQSVTLDKYSSITGLVNEGTSTVAFHTYADTGSANDPLLNRFLKEHKVSIAMGDANGPSHAMPMMTGFIFLLAPIIFLILLIVIIGKLNHILRNQKIDQQAAPGYSPPAIAGKEE
ncbi:MAG: ATP-dependent metallopeptidase FtsH/Yme1/Tma family protein [Kiritimatiellae bacterium]|nr:ATP-dependent metallopeptidase FtsH/Yme1/Tma family protein [Kiritimatiellia bacterium]